MKLVAIKGLPYQRRVVRAGEEFDCPEPKLYEFFLKSGLARRAEEPERQKRKYQRRDMQAES